MHEIQRKYIVNELNEKVAVQIDIKTFNKMEETLENYGLVKLMDEQDDGEILSLNEAKAYYQTLNKAE